MNCGCISKKDLCLIRGDTFSLDVGLYEGFEDVAANPALYQGRLVFRLDQNDSLPELLAQVSAVEATGDSLPCPVAYLHFSLTPAQTATLPPYDLVQFAELREVSGAQNVLRLFQGKLDVND